MTKKRKILLLGIPLAVLMITIVASQGGLVSLSTVKAHSDWNNHSYDNEHYNYDDHDSNYHDDYSEGDYDNDYNLADYSHSFETRLSGDEEVPEVDTDMYGNSRYFVSHGSDEIDFDLDVFNGENVTAAHLHCAPPGQNGPVVVTLFHGGSQDVDGELVSGTISAVEEHNDCDIHSVDDLVSEMKDGNIYVNVHTEQHPQGEIRGQVEVTSYDHPENYDVNYDDDYEDDYNHHSYNDYTSEYENDSYYNSDKSYYYHKSKYKHHEDNNWGDYTY